MDDATVNELAECVKRNEGLRKSIEARGLPVGPTIKWLKEHRRDLFKQAHAQKAKP